MTKNFKLVLALMLAVMMLLVSSVAFAATPATNKTITITDAQEGHTYKAYQIFTGVMADGKLTDIQWGDGVTTTFINNRVAAEVAEAWKDLTDGRPVADAVKDGLSSTCKTATKAADGTTAQFTGLTEGYYIILDTKTDSATLTNPVVYSSYMVQLTDTNATVASKHTVPSVTKKVKDEDGSTETWNDVGDFNVGDTIDYKLTGTIPSNYERYTTYKYIFHDTLSAGQSFDPSTLKVWKNDPSVAANEVTTAFDITPNTASDGASATTITVSAQNDDLKTAVAGLTSSDTIIVTYTAVLTKDAVKGLDGNNNTVTLEFSNNPDNTGDGDTGTTPPDEVLVFTYELDVEKVDGAKNETKLKDAEFVLQATAGEQADKFVKIDANGNVISWFSATATDAQGTEGQDGYVPAKSAAQVASETSGAVLKSGTDGLFKVIGLDAGTYKLYETKAPKGYNLLESPVSVVITATQVNTDEYKGSTYSTPATVLTNIAVTADSVAGSKLAADSSAKRGENGGVKILVANNSGMTLPETGGVGTTIFYVAGSILVLAAAILLITKRRMGAND